MDKKLVERIQRNEPGAFRELVESYQQMVLNVCYGFVQDGDDAQDLTQEVFIQLYHKLTSFRNEAKLSTWIYRIAVNYSLNYIRSKKRRGIMASLDSLFDTTTNKEELQMEGYAQQADSNLLAHEDRELLQRALNKLPEKQRVAITLNSLQEMSYQEVADVMEVSVNQVGVLVNRGKKKLYSLLQKML